MILTNIQNKKELINFLIHRWQIMVGFAAIERVHTASCIYAKENNHPQPKPPIFSIPHACRQIEIIKQYIISIVPEVSFIDYVYEAQAPLDPNDFIEIFIEDHKICINRVQKQLKKLKIS